MEFSATFRSRMEQISAHVSSSTLTLNEYGSTAHIGRKGIANSAPNLTLRESTTISTKEKDSSSLGQAAQFFSFEALLDTFLALVMDCRAATNQSEHVANFVGKYDKLANRLQSLRVNTQDFEVIQTLATGAVGKVCLVLGKSDQKVYAMKVLKKIDLLTRREAAFFMEERNALVFAQQSSWITTLFAAFQDEENLYLVMEYASGGSLRSLMNNREEPMPENEAKFYIAEMLLALEELHSFGYIHRDLKPENCLITESGHLKLADFGSCIRMGDSDKVTSNETVGTPDYISPEILRALEGNVNYGREVDLWSLGIILYELLFDEVPFYSESLTETYGKIMNHEKHFTFPDDISITSEAMELLKRLICKSENRIGKDGLQEIKEHIWFKGIDWKNLREAKPPFVPELSGPSDTRYFEDEESEQKKFPRKALQRTKEFTGQNLPFIGYTYVHNANAGIVFPFQQQFQDRFQTISTQSLSSNLNLNVSVDCLEASSDSFRLKELENRVETLEGSLSRSEAGRDELQGLLGRLEKDRARLDAEARNARDQADQANRDRDELDSRLSSLRRRLDAEAGASKARIESLLEERDAAVVALSNLKIEKDALRELLERHTSRDEELLLERAELEKTMESNLQRIREARSERDDLSREVEGLKSSLKREQTARDEYERELQSLLNKNDDLAVTVEALKKQLSQEALKNQKAGQDLTEMERAFTFAQVDLQAAKRQVEELREEKAALEKLAHESTTAGANVSSLEAQILHLNSQKLKDAESHQLALKQIAVLEMELGQVRETASRDSIALRDAVKCITELEARNKGLSERLSLLEAFKVKANALNEEMERDRIAKASVIVSQSQQVYEAERALEAARAEKATLINELGEARLALSRETALRSGAQKRMAELETNLQDERNARSVAEERRAKSDAALDDAMAEVARANGKVAASREENARIRADLESSEASLRELELRKRESLSREQDRDSLKRSLIAANERAARAENEARSFEAAVRESETHLALARSNMAFLQDRLAELDGENQLLRDQIEDAKGKFTTKSLDSLRGPDSKSIISESTSERQKKTLRDWMFKKKEQKAEQDKAMAKISEAEEEFKLVQGKHLRRTSNDSNVSNRSNITRMSDPIIQFDFDLKEGIQGHLKIPKSGKVKKGWKIMLAIVHDFKLYLFDKEKATLSFEDSVPIADLRSDLFVVKPVMQNELIHASARDIDCIFKIQVKAIRDGQSFSSNASNQSLKELTFHYLKVKEALEIEENMKNALQRMLPKSADASHRASTAASLEVSLNRIQKLQAELTSLNDIIALKSSSENASGDANAGGLQNLEEVSAEMFEEEVAKIKLELTAQLLEEKKYLEAASSSGSTPLSEKRSSRPNSAANSTSSSPIKSIFKAQETAKPQLTNMLKLQDELTILNSDDRAKKAILVRQLNQKKAVGHDFKIRKGQNQLADCFQCRDALGGLQAVECSKCKLLCHNGCKQLVEQSCDLVLSLRNVTPLYFMAESPSDKVRWIAGLEFFRRDLERNNQALQKFSTLGPASLPASQLGGEHNLAGSGLASLGRGASSLSMSSTRSGSMASLEERQGALNGPGRSKLR